MDFYMSPQEQNIMRARGIFGDYQQGLFPDRQSLAKFPFPHPPASMFGAKAKRKTTAKTGKTTVTKKKSSYGAKSAKSKKVTKAKTTTKRKKVSKFGPNKRGRNKATSGTKKVKRVKKKN